MRAITFSQYGGPEVLKLSEVEKPEPKDNQVLIKIFSTAVNSADYRIRSANPWLARLAFGLTKPRISILGGVFSGVIESVGKDVTKYKVGDEVFGSTGMCGAYAEYLCLSENGVLTTKPKNLSHAEASTITFGGLTALYFVQKANIQKGQKVLVYGASGSVGTSIVQIAKYYGAQVTGVCSTKNIELVKSLGASSVIDYTKEDFTKNGVEYDVVFETVDKISIETGLKALKPNGTLYLISAMPGGDTFKALWMSLTGKQKIVSGTFPEKTESLIFLKKLVESGDLKAVVDKTYDLADMVEAHKYVEAGHKAGNVSIMVCQEKLF
jgi:NADPH:quinone reductase-like Zn-dependent oxidoreductase